MCFAFFKCMLSACVCRASSWLMRIVVGDFEKRNWSREKNGLDVFPNVALWIFSKVQGTSPVALKTSIWCARKHGIIVINDWQYFLIPRFFLFCIFLMASVELYVFLSEVNISVVCERKLLLLVKFPRSNGWFRLDLENLPFPPSLQILSFEIFLTLSCDFKSRIFTRVIIKKFVYC